ncbi:MAG: hypothetical protein N3D73_02260 [Candidatus Diapherotrites archaeon]|nr:hypothetical protein [Candidatus Diapherotrites archaeon]
MKAKYFVLFIIFLIFAFNDLFGYDIPENIINNIPQNQSNPIEVPQDFGGDNDTFRGVEWVENTVIGNTSDTNIVDKNASGPTRNLPNNQTNQLAQSQNIKNMQEEIKIQQELQAQTLRKLNEVENRSNTLFLVVIFLGLILIVLIAIIFFKLFRSPY